MMRWLSLCRQKRGNPGKEPQLSGFGALVDLENLIERRSLRRNETGLANQVDDFLGICFVHEVCSSVNIFLEQRAPEVVRAEVEGNLSRLLALGEPRSLNVVEVIEVDPRYRQNLQIAYRRGIMRNDLLQRCVARFEAPGDERREAPGFILQRADGFEMFDDIVIRLDVAVHHRRS